MLVVFFPFAPGYYLSYFYRYVNASTVNPKPAMRGLTRGEPS